MLSFRNVSFLIDIDFQEGELASGKDSGSKRRVRLELIYHISLQLLLRPHHQLIWKQDSVTIWEADQGSICCIDIIVAIQSHWLTDTKALVKVIRQKVFTLLLLLMLLLSLLVNTVRRYFMKLYAVDGDLIQRMILSIAGNEAYEAIRLLGPTELTLRALG